MKLIYKNQTSVELIAYTKIPDNYGKGLLYLRFLGPSISVKAISAHLLSSNNRKKGLDSDVKIEFRRYDKRSVYCEPKTSYKVLTKMVNDFHMDCCIIHPALLTDRLNDGSVFYLNESHYFSALPYNFETFISRTIKLPMERKTLEDLWPNVFKPLPVLNVDKDNRARSFFVRPIIKLEGFGITTEIYHIHTTDLYRQAWLSLIWEYYDHYIDLIKEDDGNFYSECGQFSLIKDNQRKFSFINKGEPVITHDGKLIQSHDLDMIQALIRTNKNQSLPIRIKK